MNIELKVSVDPKLVIKIIFVIFLIWA